MSRVPNSRAIVAMATIFLVIAVTTGAAAMVPLPAPTPAPSVGPPAAPPVASESPGRWPLLVPPGVREEPPAVPLMSPAREARPSLTGHQKVLALRLKIEKRIDWRRSRALGSPQNGQLIDGVVLPAEGVHFVSIDGRRMPNPNEHRVGTDRLVRTLLKVAKDYRRANPGAPRVTVGDLSLPKGGYFGPSHQSHQNGLDVDVYFPRRDLTERAPASAGEIDRRLSQDLVDRFVEAGAEYVFVGHSTGLRGPRDVVRTEDNHDDHAHVRIR